MLKKILSLVLVGVMVLSLSACGGGSGSSNNKKGTILTDTNINNYVSFTIADEYPFIVTCNSKNKLFKFDNVSIELKVDSTFANSNISKKTVLNLDENGNGTAKVTRTGASSEKKYIVNVISVSGQVFD